jgi:hypothetical protein
VVGRKNWLFPGSPNGADAAATLHSLIETAKACRLHTYQYLRRLFEKCPMLATKPITLADPAKRNQPDRLTAQQPTSPAFDVQQSHNTFVKEPGFV